MLVNCYHQQKGAVFMSNIKIKNLEAGSYQSCLDNDSFLVDLTDKEATITSGGIFMLLATAAGVYYGAYQIGRDARRRQEHKNGNVCYP
jgi:hypothetical protein